MPQYQSFPGAPGDSLTLEKLKKLALPDLSGKTFLDVGCNEGFFCGFALAQGASRSVGVDHSIGFVQRARARFPGCEFHASTWEQLPDGHFDVILLASALHYAADQEALVRRLVDKLTDDGVLVLELGIASSRDAEWVEVKRGIDTRLFPTMPLLRQLLAGYAWKWMGPSVSQSGDPVGRHVLHVSRRRRAAYLLMQPPAYGKSSIAAALFRPAAVPVVSGDQVLGKIAAGKIQVPEGLAEAVREGYSPFVLDQVIQRVFAGPHAADLVEVWTRLAGEGDFALDMYVPAEHQVFVREALERAGYLPVSLNWERPGAQLMSKAVMDSRADAFYLSLAGAPGEAGVSGGLVGFVDEATLEGGRLSVRGWAADGSGDVPAGIEVQVGGALRKVAAFERQLRPDVQRHVGLPHALVGYRFTMDVDGIEALRGTGADFRVQGRTATGELTVFQLSAPLAAEIAGGGTAP